MIEAVFPDKLPEINHAIRIRRPAAAAAEEDLDRSEEALARLRGAAAPRR